MDRSTPRIIFITLAILLITPICAGNVHEATICYIEDSVETGDTFDLEQGYRLTIDDIRKNDAAISISGGSEEILNTSISGEYTYKKEIDGIGYDIIRISMKLGDGYPVQMELEQYRDPDKPFDYPLIGAVSISIKEGEREPLKAGYTLEATSIIDDNAVLTLYKDNRVRLEKPIGYGERFVYTTKIDGQRRTILIAKLDHISGNDSVHVSELSQFKDPESTDEGAGEGEGDDSKWNTQLVESMIFRYLLSIFVFACVFVLILGIVRQVRR